MNVSRRHILGVKEQYWDCGQLADVFFDGICPDEGIRRYVDDIMYFDDGAPMCLFKLAE